MDKSAVILAGGISSRFGQNKGLLQLADKPLIRYVTDAVDGIVNETIIVASSKAQAASFAEVIGSNTRIVIDASDMQCPLIGALTGFENAHGKYSLLLACDTPMLSKDVLSLLLELCINRNAVVVRWPNGYIEPLQAVYCTEAALQAARNALNEEKSDMRSMVERLRGVRYVSTLILQQLDPELRTLFNVNTPLDFKRAKMLLKRARGRDFRQH